jgi:methionine sulfoxide reductase heme-binding subunit
MGHAYQAVGWNPQKKRYDRLMWTGILLYLALFLVGGLQFDADSSVETLLIRGVGTAALILLHITLCIGPLARIDSRFLPLLYNRRHMGVTMFVLAALHGAYSLLYFHAFGDVNPLVSLLGSNPRWDSLAHFPFQPLGFLALLILFLMAATSHDFWLANLTAPTWKALHLLVYVAYALIVMHVVLGVLQAETSPVLALVLGAGVVLVIGLHLKAGFLDGRKDKPLDAQPWMSICSVDEIENGRATFASIGGERIAVFKYDGKVSAVSGACQHQNGPLAEGRVIDGCIVCPWHGYQYKPECGSSPEPFTEKVPTFRVRVTDGMIELDPDPLPAGTYVEPALVGGTGAAEDHNG